MQRWFLSYNSRDLNLVQGLEAAVRRKDPEAHLFFAPKSLLAGGYWLPRLADEIAKATAFVLLVGEKGLGPWQVVEYYEALDKRVTTPDFPVVLVLLEGQPAPGLPFLRQLHWIVSADPSSEHTAVRLLEAGAGGGGRPGELWRYTSPYRGLAAMTDADSDFFFGRQSETRAVLAALSANSESLPVLLGNSGVGKSSLAQAGVLGALKRQAFPEANGGAWPHVFHDSRRWCFLSFKPGTEPLKALVDPFLDIWQFAATDPERANQKNGWISLLRDGKANVRDLIDATERRYQEIDQPKPPAFFIYVDQGEELYVRADEVERRRFSELLAQALGDPRVHALMSLRADFLGALQNDEALYAVHHKIDVPPLREAELCEVVSRPAALLSARFETVGLASDIARRTAEESAKDAGALPLLSYLLDDMWTHMIRRGDGVLRLPAQAVELGGVLAERANAFLARQPKAEETLRRVLTLKLATVREDGEPTRRSARRSEFTDEEWRMVSQLADHPHRLLVTATPEGGETYAEVAHEAIFRRWSKLRDWIVAEREFLLWKSGLEADRRRWEHSAEASRNDALLMGLSLAQAQSWLARRAEDLPQADREFIDLSIQRDVLERRQRESLRRRIFGIAVVALVGMSALALFSVIQWREALTQRDRAEHAVASFIARLFSASGVGDIEDLNQAISVDPTDATSYFLRAVLYSTRNDYDGTITDLNRALELDPNFLAAYVSRGAMYEKKGDYDRAIADYDRALKLDPKNAIIYNSRGWSYHLKGMYDRAITDYDEALKINPKYSIAYNNRGLDYDNKGDFDHAMSDYEQAIKFNPKYAIAYSNRGLIHRKRGDNDRALADFDEAIKLDPKNPIFYNNRGWTYQAKQNYEAAIADYDQALRLDPTYALAYANRGWTYYSKGAYDRAIADYDEAIKRDPKNAITYNNRGLIYDNKGELDRALADYEQATRLNPKYAISQSNLGLIYHKKGNYERALAEYDKAIELDPKNAITYNNRGLTRYAKKDYDGAIDDYDRAILLNPAYVAAYVNRGVIYRIRGDYDRAISEFDQAIKHGPNLSRSYYQRGSVYRAKGQHDQALEDYALAIKLDAKEAGSLSARCWTRLVGREPEAALEDCNKSIELRSDDAYALEGRGMAFLALGRAEDALGSFDAALQIEPKLASSRYGRGLAKRKAGDDGGGDADMAAAKAINEGVASEFARLGIN